jgi:hypothetical protein
MYFVQVEFFWVLTSCSAVVGYQRSRGPCCLHLLGDGGGSTDLWNAAILPQHYMTSQPRRPRLESSPPWKPQISQCKKGVTKSFRTGCLERELQMAQLSATRCSCIATLWVSLVGYAAITLCVASQRVFIFVSVYFVIYSVRKVLDTPS